MQILTKTLLAIIYPLVLLAWITNLLLGRDRLRLHNTPSETSCWIERRGYPSTASYFSEASRLEGDDEPSAARALGRLLRCLAGLYKPPRQAAGAVYEASAHREQDIPDEIYTLW
jgi:hypothetical protein